MRVQFCGAARTVTGSCHLITLDDGFQILLDCGLYQGNDDEMESFNHNWFFDPLVIDCMILSHAHIDHAGRIPKLSKDGFQGPIVCTHATRDLSAIMLMDSAKIQMRDMEYRKKSHSKNRGVPRKPLYVVSDVKRVMDQFIGVGYEKWYPINDRVSVLFRDAGHILGSSNVTLRIKRADGRITHLGFTGDIGRPNRPILRDPISMPECDYVICESTYGNKFHESNLDQSKELLRIIQNTCLNNKGKLIIPAFSVGRTQEIVHLLDSLESSGKMPRLKFFVDSPLAVNATDIFQSHPECFDDEMMEYMLFDSNPFGFKNLNYVRKVEASKRINKLNEPCIIISASGMASSGRVQHHLFNNIEKANTTVLMVGYCAPKTLGGQLLNGNKRVHIFGQRLNVNANIETLHSFSAHGDQREMLDFLDNQDREKLQKVFLVHGEIDRQEDFKLALTENGYKDVKIPELGENFQLD